MRAALLLASVLAAVTTVLAKASKSLPPGQRDLTKEEIEWMMKDWVDPFCHGCRTMISNGVKWLVSPTTSIITKTVATATTTFTVTSASSATSSTPTATETYFRIDYGFEGLFEEEQTTSKTSRTHPGGCGPPVATNGKIHVNGREVPADNVLGRFQLWDSNGEKILDEVKERKGEREL